MSWWQKRKNVREQTLYPGVLDLLKSAQQVAAMLPQCLFLERMILEITDAMAMEGHADVIVRQMLPMMGYAI